MIDIGEVAAATGLSVATLRYYEQRGLIASVGRRGLRRQFDDSILDRLALVALGRLAGFPLDEIAAMLPSGDDAGIDRDRLRARADELDATIAGLCLVRDNLRHAAECPEVDHLSCPSFRRLMGSALPARPARGSGSSDPRTVRPPGRSW